ncbi:flagellar filament capping protein FliD [Cohnella suwonensis]|uniref:Flagellar hook-associated protein 2 n=1 Tax=Cohnella suwonensis TaxID=696072 RepID=A0ABW0LWR7_9BACL
MRISGFSSGMDIDQIVKDLMRTKRVPMDKLTQQRTTLEWQREQFRDVNIKMVDFRNNKLFNYGLEGAINAKKVNITGNTAAVSANAISGAVAGAMTVSVGSLATAATTTSTTGVGAIDTSKKLIDIKGVGAGKIDYTADGSGNVTFTLTNGASNATITLNENTDTLTSMVSKINSSNANITAFVDSVTGKLSLTSKTTGAGTITFSDSVPSNLLSKFNLPAATAGLDANVTINGIATTRSSNKFTANGVEITLNATTASTGGTASTLSIVSNTDKIVETIKSFIKDYNDVLGTVNNKINEERYRKYPPLTADQKEEMTEDEIKLWEEKAKSGLLRRDTTLSKMASDSRLAMITSVNIGGTAVNMTSLGITTGSYTERGKLVLKDEAKLRAAIDANPDQVMKLFTQQTTQTDANLRISPTNPDNGLFNRLSNVVMTALDDLATRVGTSRFSSDKDTAFSASSYIGEQLRSIDFKITDLTQRLSLVESRYYKQFTAMETAMNRYSAQSSSLFGASK